MVRMVWSLWVRIPSRSSCRTLDPLYCTFRRSGWDGWWLTHHFKGLYGISINGGTPTWMAYYRKSNDNGWGYPHFRKPPCVCAWTFLVYLYTPKWPVSSRGDGGIEASRIRNRYFFGLQRSELHHIWWCHKWLMPPEGDVWRGPGNLLWEKCCNLKHAGEYRFNGISLIWFNGL